MTRIGFQLIVDLYECDPALLDQPAEIERILGAAADDCGATVLHQFFHHFNPAGVSGALIIAESHIAIHTWPEHRYAALDLFSCSATFRASECVAAIQAALAATSADIREIPRGETLPQPDGSRSQPLPLPPHAC